jgi:hypothetical protein
MPARTLLAPANNSSAHAHYTGIVCRRCLWPGAVLLESTPRAVVLECPECGYSWSDAPPITLGAAASSSA